MEKLLAAKLRNAFVKAFAYERSNYIINLRNIIVNGDKRGCSGFIQNLSTGNTVYINTEPGVYTKKYLYRYARNDQDYTGYRNMYTDNKDELVSSVVSLLNADMPEWKNFGKT